VPTVKEAGIATTMKQLTRTRREFLAGAGTGIGVAWISAHWPAIASAQAHAAASTAAPTSSALEFLTPEEARQVDAITAQIVPTDDTPGAREAGALYFVDRSLHTWAAASAAPFRNGLRDFRAKFSSAHPSVEFADADAETQIEFLSEEDSTPFFATVRFLTLLGMFANPSCGGNRGGAGWRLIGFEDTHGFSPPFGYYDRGYAGFVVPKEKA
jgi:gluconate 2-dehydrogenase gamma chain